MIEVKVAGTRMTGWNGMALATPVAKGRFMYNSGAFTAAHAPKGTPGFSAVGDSPRMLLANQYTHSGWGVFPVEKLILQSEGADQDLDTITSGTSLIFYVGGEYETDEYDITVSGTGTLPGNQLWLNSVGQISQNGVGSVYGTTNANPTNYFLPPIGEVVKVSSFPATSNWYSGGNTSGVDSYKKTVWYRLYPWHAAPVINVSSNLS